MKLVIFHYHLNRGGVSRVIENHLRSLATLDADRQPSSVIIAYGGRGSDWNFSLADDLPFQLEFVAIPSLDYDTEHSEVQPDLFAALLAMLESHGCEPKSTVLHAHNHSLGKNAAFPVALKRLAEKDWRILLQLHDFAEDLRPHNYAHMVESFGGIESLHASLYPQADHIHYSTLNARDFDLLAKAGIAADRLHRLPNPVASISDSSADQTGEDRIAARHKLAAIHGVHPTTPYVLYPVRGIQRKNLGELLMWASLCDDTTFAVTLPPMNPRELEHYESWKKLASNLSLPVLFGVGEDLTLAENYAAADHVITTSVAEGFGLVFLEAALMDRPLVGRNLPGITDDFLAAGITFPGLRDSLTIPLSCLNREQQEYAFAQHAQRLRKAYDVTTSDSDGLDAAIRLMFANDTIDFGRLDSAAQKHVLQCVHDQPKLRESIRKLNPIVSQVGQLTDPSLASAAERDVVAANRRLIQRHYSLPSTGRSLHAIYQTLIQCKTGEVELRQAVASYLQQAFLSVDQLYPLRLEQ